jgi:hypothetical protein
MRASVLIFQTLGSLVGGRVYPAPRKEADDQTMPYITYQKISADPLVTLENDWSDEQLRVQVNVYHNTLNLSELLAIQVKEAMKAQTVSALQILDSRADYDFDTKLHSESIDFSMWQNSCT